MSADLCWWRNLSSARMKNGKRRDRADVFAGRNTGSPKITTYAATKAFNTTFAEGLWKELKPMGIDVLASCAGAILTPDIRIRNTRNLHPEHLPEQVAAKTLNALGKGPVTVPGTVNKLARWFMGRILPRRWAINLMHQQTKNYRDDQNYRLFSPHGFFTPLSLYCITYFPAVGWTACKGFKYR